MGKLKYEQFDVEKLGVVEKDYVGSGIDTSSSSESLSREFQRRQNGSSRSWGQLILITLLTFLLWMVIFTFIGFLPIQSYNSYFQSPCGQQEQAALSKTPSLQAGPGDEIPVGDLALGVGIIEIRENEVDATIVVGTFGTAEQLPQLPQEEPVANFSFIPNFDNAIGPLDPLVPEDKQPPVLILPPAPIATDDAAKFLEQDPEQQPVLEEFPMLSWPDMDVIPEQAILSFPVYEDNAEDEAEMEKETELILVGNAAAEGPALVEPAVATEDKIYLVSTADEKASWNDALEFCFTYGMQLVTIDSEEKQQEVSSVLAGEKVTLADMVWTSGRSENGDGSGPYAWASTGDRVSYTNWAGHNGVNEDQVGGCIAMNLVDPALPDYYAWTKSDCTARYRFMCEI